MKRYVFIFAIATVCIWNQQASAFWGSDSTDANSGLNVAAGFDINTITTVAGKVTVPPERKGEEQHTVMTVAIARGVVTVVLGPWWYWEKQVITLTKNQDITITGSLAQGKNGALYMFAQRLENRSTGETVTLRSETGKPLWSRGGSGSQNGNGSGSHSGTGTRGSGMRGGRR
jgi:uncharacterized membrane protein YgcG